MLQSLVRFSLKYRAVVVALAYPPGLRNLRCQER